MAIEKSVLVEYIKATFVGNVHHRAEAIVDFLALDEADQLESIQTRAVALVEVLMDQKTATLAEAAALDERIAALQSI
jgi:hypothetical protein